MEKFNHITIKRYDVKPTNKTKYYIKEANLYIVGWFNVLNWMYEHGDPTYTELVIGRNF